MFAAVVAVVLVVVAAVVVVAVVVVVVAVVVDGVVVLGECPDATAYMPLSAALRTCVNVRVPAMSLCLLPSWLKLRFDKRIAPAQGADFGRVPLLS